MIEIVVSGQQEESSQAEQADRRGFGHLRDLYGIEVSSAGCVAVVALNDHLIEQAAVEVHHTGAAFGDILAGWCVMWRDPLRRTSQLPYILVKNEIRDAGPS